MCGTGEAEAAEVSRIAVDGSGARGLAGTTQGPTCGERAPLAANSDPGVAGSGLDPCGQRSSGGHLSARGATNWLALFGTRAGSRAERRPASQARQDAGRQAAGCDRRDGVRPAPRGLRPVDYRADGPRSQAARNGRQGRTRDDTPVVCEPRAKAVAGKKCGVSPSWTRNT